jgi:hypothetical protein
MRSRRTLIALFSMASVVLGTASAAQASSTHPVAVWEMDEPAGAHTMRDSTGHGLDGVIGAEVATGVRVDGARAFRFSRLDPDTPPPRPRHVATVRDNAQLDPGTRDYAVTVRLRTTYQFGNVVQKGQATVPGGSWKLQIPNGILQCWFRGEDGQVLISSPRRLNDGRWHTIRCDRTESGLTLAVDGSQVARKSGRTGWISNSWPVSIGGKTTCDQVKVGCDYYAGDLDYVEIDAR